MNANKRQHMIDVALDLFLRKGFPNTSMREIAEAAKASKETLYNYFGTKEGMLLAVVEQTADRIMKPIEIEAEHRPAQVLFDFGSGFLEQIMSPPITALIRVLATEAPRNPELARHFLEAGPRRAQSSLAGYLRLAKMRGEIVCTEPDMAAIRFMGLIAGFFPQLRLLGMPVRLSQSAKKRWVQEAVDIFLASYGRNPRHRRKNSRPKKVAADYQCPEA